MQIAINNAIINGTPIAVEDLVNNSAIVKYTGIDRKIVTLNHAIHNVRTSIVIDSEFTVYGNATNLENTDVTTDEGNYGVDCEFYLDDELQMECIGQVSCTYNDEERTTRVVIKGGND